MAPEFHGTIKPGDVEQGDIPSPISIVFPRADVSDVSVAMEQLFEAFPDHEPILSAEFDDYWVFRLVWVSNPHIFVDPGVSNTAAVLYGLSRSGIGSYRELHRWGKRDVVISMVHSWALLAPARVIARRGGNPLSWVVHFDDHTDLMAPLVEPLPQSGSLRDQIFEEDIDLGIPAAVVAAINRGIVSKGNFLTAYLLAYPGCRAVHVGHNLVEQDFRLSRQTEIVTLGGRRFERHGFVLDPLSAHEPWTFRQTRSLPTDLPIGEQEGIWLDIDLDYFWNRYNGDSDRRCEIALPGEQDEVLRRVNDFLAKFNDVNWLARIEAVSIAVSPGFFPAEYWAMVIAAVCDGIRKRLES